jgi:hypothetical protein
MTKNTLLQRVFHRLATSNADLESEEMQRAVEAESRSTPAAGIPHSRSSCATAVGPPD